jgi:pyridoxine 5-phosphate synthase
LRKTPYPDLIAAARLAVAAGADSITVHLREDRRHIQDRDVAEIRQSISIPLNLELAVTDEMIGIAEKIRPAYCCFVPERRQEITTEGGLDVVGNQDRITDACARTAVAGVRASLFVDADLRQIEAAAATGARVIEIHTGHYADAAPGPARDRELRKIDAAVSRGVNLGLQVNAGHGLNYTNVAPIAALAGVRELNIGHAIVAQAVFTGLDRAVSEMKSLIRQSRG